MRLASFFEPFFIAITRLSDTGNSTRPLCRDIIVLSLQLYTFSVIQTFQEKSGLTFSRWTFESCGI